MTIEAEPFNEQALQAWLDATEDEGRFESAPEQKSARPTERAFSTSWIWVVATVAFFFYLGVGLWMIYGADFAIGDAIARASSARAIAHSRDQHVMAVGFYWMPLPAFAEVPFMAVFSRLGVPALAMVAPTALATAMTIPILARIGRDLAVRKWIAATFVTLFALNPYTIFCAGNGMSEAWLVLALAGCFAAYLRWTDKRRIRDLGRLGLWLAVGQMTRHEMLTVVVVFCVLVAIESAKGRRVATALTVAAPSIFGLFAWTIVSFVITRHGFWKAIQDSDVADRVTGSWLPDERTVATVATYSATLSLRFAPGIVLAVLFAGFGRELFGHILDVDGRPHLRAVAIVAIGGLFPAQIAFLLLQRASYGDPRYYMPLILLFTIASFIALNGRPRIGGRGAALVVCGLAGCVSSFVVIGDPGISAITGEPAVIRALLGTEQSAADSNQARSVNLGDWRAFTADLDRRLRPGDVIVLDTSVAAAVHLFSRHPMQIATELDSDSAQQLQLPDPGYTWAVVVPGNYGSLNPTVQALLRGTPPRGKRWEKVDVPLTPAGFRGSPELWHLVDAPTSPALLTAAAQPTKPQETGQ